MRPEDSRPGRIICLSLFFLLGLGVLASCGGPTEPDPEVPSAGLTFIAGAEIADTVDATPAQALIVEVRGEDGGLLVDHPVHFSAIVEGTGFQAQSTVLVGAMGSPGFAGEMVDSTDAQGRAAARIKMGRLAGVGGVVVTVPVAGIRDTANFMIEPGAGVGMRASPADTAVFVDHSFAISAEALDRYGNPRPSGSAEFESNGTVVTLSDGQVTGEQIGRTSVVVRSDEGEDVAWVSVVPQGEIAFIEVGPGPAREVVVRGLDGANPRRLIGAGSSETIGLTSWSVDGESIVYHHADSERLRVVDMEGRDRRLMGTPVADAEEWPHYSRDGEWIYWSGDPGSGGRALFRARPDGSGVEQIGPDATTSESDRQPTPSPSGDRLAYRSNRNGSTLRILEVATGTGTDLGVIGDHPRWSPVDDRIAFTASRQVKIVRPDGTVRDVTDGSGVSYRDGLAWSPDGNWLLVARSFAGMELLEPETGQTVPLPYTNRNMTSPSWRPVTGS